MGEDGSPGDENSLARPLGWPLPSLWHPAGARRLCLEPASLALGLGLQLLDSWARQPWEVLKGTPGLLDVSNLPPHLPVPPQSPMAG